MRLAPRVALTAACVLSACGPVPPAAAPESAQDDAWIGVPSIPALLDASERLALTSAQVLALDSLSRAWSSRDDSLSREIGALRGRARRDPVGSDRDRTARVAMTRNHRATAEAVGAVLDERQRAIACEIQGARSRAERPRAGTMSPGRIGWPWCAAPPG